MAPIAPAKGKTFEPTSSIPAKKVRANKVPTDTKIMPLSVLFSCNIIAANPSNTNANRTCKEWKSRNRLSNGNVMIVTLEVRP